MDDNLAILLLMFLAIGAAVGLIGITTLMRANRRNDRPPAPPIMTAEADTLLIENDRLRGQLGCLEERLAALERSVTDPAARTARDVETLRQDM